MDKEALNEKDLEFYLKQEYRICLHPLSEEEGGGWYAEIPDLPGCMSDGESKEEALKNLEEAKRAWIFAMLERGKKVPLPQKEEEEEYSGRLTFRLSKSLHRELARMAKSEGVSLNQLLLTLISLGRGILSGKRTHTWIEVRETPLRMLQVERTESYRYDASKKWIPVLRDWVWREGTASSGRPIFGPSADRHANTRDCGEVSSP